MTRVSDLAALAESRCETDESPSRFDNFRLFRNPHNPTNNPHKPGATIITIIIMTQTRTRQVPVTGTLLLASSRRWRTAGLLLALAVVVGTCGASKQHGTSGWHSVTTEPASPPTGVTKNSTESTDFESESEESVGASTSPGLRARDGFPSPIVNAILGGNAGVTFVITSETTKKKIVTASFVAGFNRTCTSGTGMCFTPAAKALAAEWRGYGSGICLRPSPITLQVSTSSGSDGKATLGLGGVTRPLGCTSLSGSLKIGFKDDKLPGVVSGFQYVVAAIANFTVTW